MNPNTPKTETYRPEDESVILNKKEQQDQPHYKEYELDPAYRNQQYSQVPIDINTPQQQQVQQQQVQQPDPIQQVKQMISAGYTPSLALLQNVANLLKYKNEDWANTWFAVLIQKLIKEHKS